MRRFAIRPYRPDDAARMAQLYFDSARVLGRRRYSQAQVEVWAPTPAPSEVVHARAADGRITLVAVDDEAAVLGYGDLEADGHIDHLYCCPKAAGGGVAAALLDALIAHAADAGTSRLYVEASELARGLFQRKGFAVTNRRDFTLSGVAIHNYRMERIFSGD